VGYHDHVTEGGQWDITTISLKVGGWDIMAISLRVGGWDIAGGGADSVDILVIHCCSDISWPKNCFTFYCFFLIVFDSFDDFWNMTYAENLPRIR
jgi:hypothetical protein